MDIAPVAVTEPSSDQDVTAATLILTTSSGGSLDVNVVVEVRAFADTASESFSVITMIISVSIKT